MKSSHRIIAGCVAVLFCISATVVLGAAPTGSASVLIATGALGQSGASADSGQGGGRSLVPRFLRRRDATPSTDPFTAAGRGLATNPPIPSPTTSPAGAPSPAETPSTATALVALPPSARPIVGPTSNADVKTRSNRLLLDARKALAYGDTKRATELVNQAKAIGVSYGPHDDSPSKIEETLNNYNGLMQQRPANGSTLAFHRSHARLLVEQARGLMQWREFDEAERLAREAEKLPVTYSPFDKSPKDVLAQINTARRRTSPSATPPGVAASPNRFAATRPLRRLRAPGGKLKVQELVAKARVALRQGDFTGAEQFAREAESLRVPDSAFAPQEDRPTFVLLDVQKARLRAPDVGSTLRPRYANGPNLNNGGRQGSSVRPVQAIVSAIPGATPTAPEELQAPYQLPPLTFNAPPKNPSPAKQPTSEQSPASSRPSAHGMQVFSDAEQALQQGNIQRARELFAQAEKQQNELDETTRQRLRGRLQYLGQKPGSDSIEAVAQQQEILRRQVSARLADFQRRARNVQQAYPDRSMALLEEARGMIVNAGLDPQTRDQLAKRLETQVIATRNYIKQNAPRLALDARNQTVKDTLRRERQVRVEVEEKLAFLVDEFNEYMDQQRWADAEAVARKAAEIAPNEQVVVQLKWMSRFVRRTRESIDLRERKEDSVIGQLGSVEESSEPFDDRNPFRFGADWEDLTQRRKGYKPERRLSEEELEIRQKLRTPVSLRFEKTSLSEIMDYLSKLADVPMLLDPQGLAEEGVAPDTPVTINLSKEIQLKSALNLILQPLRLSYVIRDEVLKITSEQFRDGEVYTQTYEVANLVIPIPNFAPSANMGMMSAINEAYRQSSYFASGFGGHAPLTEAATAGGATNNAAIDPAVLAQVNAPGAYPGAATSTQPVGAGPGGLGGGSQADFGSLISLITSTVDPESWDEVGGPGSISEFENNLSLVISQTQDVHEKIADLLEQLRRLQDLQVTIEVRFITLNDNFFERIGVDFDFDIDDDTDRPFQTFGRPDRSASTAFDPATMLVKDGLNLPPRNVDDTDHGRSTTVGLSMPGMFSADLDIPINQGSFQLAVPQFGGFNPGAGATVGFAILSDLEAFFFIEASQGDRRTNVLQAPKVTLFNGQQAIVSDTSQSPFVISVIPVVGDFAAALQPVIVVLNEGTFLTVQAVVSNDRRFVRLTVVPFFSTIGEVNTFTFTGSETTTIDSAGQGDADATTGNTPRQTTTRQGTTVQLPTFSFVTVTTTVSVPDGGTVLLGGIKRLSEGRNEFGVPILNKIPYVNRLFKNVAIGRETQSLMMMVTPRIIIQEEEEELLLGGG